MTTDEVIRELTASAEVKFKKLGITDEMYDAIVDYLIEAGALNYCGTASGCNGNCPSGQSCTRFTYRGNCLCVKPR